MTFELDLYRQGYLAVTLPVLWIVYTCGTNKTREKMMCHIFAVKGGGGGGGGGVLLWSLNYNF